MVIKLKYKFFTKILLTNLTACFLILSLFGFLLIYSSFQNNLKQTITISLKEDESILLPYLKRKESLFELNDIYLSYLINDFSLVIFSPDYGILYPKMKIDKDYSPILIKGESSDRYYYLKKKGNIRTIIIVNKIYLNNQEMIFLSEKNISQLYTSLGNEILQGIILLILSGIFLAVILFFISRSLTNPLKVLLKGINSIIKGNYRKEISITGSYELEEIADKFNSMSGVIENKINLLNQENQDKESFISSFTHELKTPLTNIIGYSEFITNRELSIQEINNYAKIINKEGKRLHSIGLDLRDYILLKNVRKKSCLHPLYEIAERIKEVSYFLSIEKNIDLDIYIEGDSVSIDIELYLCCCLNIIDNSIKASEHGSDIIIKLEVNNNMFKTEIKDFGKGMDKNKIQHICKPFYQGDQSRTSGNEGIGMGLSIVEQIVLNNLCGKLSISSIPGHGTSVWINIPVENY